MKVAKAAAWPRTDSGKISPTSSQLIGPKLTCIMPKEFTIKLPDLGQLGASPHSLSSDWSHGLNKGSACSAHLAVLRVFKQDEEGDSFASVI